MMGDPGGFARFQGASQRQLDPERLRFDLVRLDGGAIILVLLLARRFFLLLVGVALLVAVTLLVSVTLLVAVTLRRGLRPYHAQRQRDQRGRRGQNSAFRHSAPVVRRPNCPGGVPHRRRSQDDATRQTCTL